MLYGTTTRFLERLGLDSLDELPPLGDFVPDASVVEALERGLRVNDDPTVTDPELDRPGAVDGRRRRVDVSRSRSEVARSSTVEPTPKSTDDARVDVDRVTTTTPAAGPAPPSSY